MLDETSVSPDAAIDIDAQFYGQLEQSAPTTDPRMVRWGYNPGLRNIMLPPRATGLKDPFIPIGKFIPHTTFRTPQENCTLDEYKEKEYFVEVPAADVVDTFARSLAKDIAGGTDRDWGYQSFGYGEKDAVKMAAANQILIPTLQTIRETFGELSPIDARCKGEDELDLGDPRTHCASCHLEWIRSDACQVSIADAVQAGRTVQVRTPTGIVPVAVMFTAAELEEYRSVVQKGLEIFKKQAHKDWSVLLGELENKKRDQIQESEHFLRKDLHQARPQNREEDLIERVLTAQAGQPAAAPAADNSAVINMLAQSQAMMAESIARTNEMLAQMAANQPAPPAPVPAATQAATTPKPNKAKGADTKE